MKILVPLCIHFHLAHGFMKPFHTYQIKKLCFSSLSEGEEEVIKVDWLKLSLILYRKDLEIKTTYLRAIEEILQKQIKCVFKKYYGYIYIL